jgi:hypothetical protein
VSFFENLATLGIVRLQERWRIRKTIKHWERLIAFAKIKGTTDQTLNYPDYEDFNELGENFGSDDCPLCQKYREPNGIDTERDQMCLGCPLYKKFGRCGEENDTEDITRNAYMRLAYAETWHQWIERANIFLSQIKSL